MVPNKKVEDESDLELDDILEPIPTVISLESFENKPQKGEEVLSENVDEK